MSIWCTLTVSMSMMGPPAADIRSPSLAVSASSFACRAARLAAGARARVRLTLVGKEGNSREVHCTIVLKTMVGLERGGPEYRTQVFLGLLAGIKWRQLRSVVTAREQLDRRARRPGFWQVLVTETVRRGCLSKLLRDKPSVNGEKPSVKASPPCIVRERRSGQQ